MLIPPYKINPSTMLIRLTFLILFLLVAISAIAQTTIYHPFPTDTARCYLYEYPLLGRRHWRHPNL